MSRRAIGPSRPSGRRASLRAYVAAGLASTLLLGACGSEPGTGAVPAQEQPAAVPSEDEGPVASSSPAETRPDPHALTGVSIVSSLDDPAPIEGGFEQSLPVTVTDFEGREVTVTDTSRILALDLAGSLSRTVIALGYGDSLVGRSVSSTEKQLADLPVVTAEGHSLNAEAILNLRPTIIIADRTIGPPEVLEQLSASGIPVVLTDPDHTLETNSERINDVAEILGAPEAGEALVERTEAEIDAALDEISAWVPDEPLTATFLYVRGTAGVFFILGAENGTSALIESVGARDIASEQGIVGTVPANAESLLLLNPDVIFTMADGLESADGVEGLLSRPGVADTTAGRKQRIIAIPDGMSLSFGPQTGDVLVAVAEALYGVEPRQ